MVKQIKKLAFIILAFVSLGSLAQSKKEDNIQLFDKIDSTIILYLKYSRLVGSSGDRIDAKTVQEFKNLFVAGAIIIDEICPAYYDKDSLNPYRLVERTVDNYCIKVSEVFPGGLQQVKMINANISFTELKNNKVFVVMEKTVKGRTNKGLRLENKDTIEIEILVSEDKKNIKIANTKLIGHTLIFLNDQDRDFVYDDIDPTPYPKPIKKPKPVTEPQKPSEGNTKPAVAVNPFARSQFQLGFNLFAGSIKNQFDFTDNFSTTYLKSELTSGNKNAKPVIVKMQSKGFELMAGFFLKPGSGFGIKTGVQFQNIKGGIEKEGFDVTYRETDKWGNIYLQHIKATADNTLKENFNINQWSIPIVLAYKQEFTPNFGFQLEGGINLVLNFTGNSNPDSNNKFDFEAVYYHEPNTSQFEYKPDYGSTEETNGYIFLTHKNEAQDDIKIDDLSTQGYNIGLNKNPKDKDIDTKVDFAGKIGFVLKPSLYFKISPVACINLGALIMSNSYSNNKRASDYFMTKEVSKDYNTMLNSMDKFKTTTIAFSLGFHYSFLSKKTKQ